MPTLPRRAATTRLSSQAARHRRRQGVANIRSGGLIASQALTRWRHSTHPINGPASHLSTAYVAPKLSKGGSKMQNGRFPSKSALRLKKVCNIISLCENSQRQSSKPFISLTIRAEMIGGGRTLLPEILRQTDRVGAKSPIFDLSSLVALQP